MLFIFVVAVVVLYVETQQANYSQNTGNPKYFINGCLKEWREKVGGKIREGSECQGCQKSGLSEFCSFDIGYQQEEARLITHSGGTLQTSYKLFRAKAILGEVTIQKDQMSSFYVYWSSLDALGEDRLIMLIFDYQQAYRGRWFLIRLESGAGE